MDRSATKGKTLVEAILSTDFLLVITVLTVHFFLLMSGRSFLPQSVLFIFFFLSLVLLPGFVLSGIFIPGLDRPFRLMISFLAGTSLFYLVLIIFSLFGLDIFYTGIVIPILTLLAAIFRGSIGFGTVCILVERKGASEGYSKITMVLLLLLLLTVSFLVLSYGDPLTIISDSPDHIAYIRTISRTHEVFPSSFLYEDGGLLTRDVRKGLAHSMWGSLNCMTGYSDVEAIWPLISTIGSIFNVLAFFCAGVLLFGSPAVGLLSAFVLVFMHYDGLAGLKLIYIAYGFPFGKIFLILFLAFQILFLQTRRRCHLVLAMLASFAATATHIGHFILGFFLVAVLSAGEWIEQDRAGKKRLIKRIFPVLAGSIVFVNILYILIRYIRDYAPNNIIHTHIQGMLKFTDHIYIMNPFIVYRLMIPLTIFVFASLILLWKGSSKVRELRLLLWGTIGIYATIFNPLIVPVASKAISYMLLRFVSAVPPMIVAACLLREIWMRLTGRKAIISRAGAITGLMVVIVLFGSVFAKIPGGFAYRKGIVPIETTCGNLSDCYEVLRNSVPAGSVIVSDPLTSYTIPAFTDHYVVCTFDQHSIPNDSTALERIIDCRSILFSSTPIGEVVQLLTRYNADYILVNGRIPGSLQSMYWKLGKAQAKSIDERMARFPRLFELVYSKQALTLYKIHLEEYDKTVEDLLPESEIVDPVTSIEEEDGCTQSGIDGVMIRSISFGKNKVRRGETLPVRVEWVATAECSPASYRAFIRFDTGFDKNFLYNRAYGKVYRKIVEIITGNRFRFRGNWQPLSGLYPPDMWPLHTIVGDSTEIQVPFDISPGEYRVSVRLMKIAQYPNYFLRDILTDEDAYQGVEIGRITVE